MLTHHHSGIGAIGAIILTSLAAIGCQPSHVVRQADPTRVTVCAKCYDEIRAFETSDYGDPPTYSTTEVRKHLCAECKTEMIIYIEGDTPKIRCAKCAPAGVDCDRCQPPAGWKPRGS